ncbi:hypothetical protein Lal_00002131, partial [Lupinus albus]
ILLNDRSLLLRSERLLQQYVIDNYVKVEAERLRWIHQNNICARFTRCFACRIKDADLTQHCEDGRAIVLNDGKPYIFLTMTCNPSWCESLLNSNNFKLHKITLT